LLFTRPLSAVMLLIALVSFIYPFIKRKKKTI
jgi:hypothetical protein